LEDGLGFTWSFLTAFTEPFLKLLLSQKDSPAVAATMPYFAHAFDVVWHALATVAVVDFDDLYVFFFVVVDFDCGWLIYLLLNTRFFFFFCSVERDNAYRIASVIRLFFFWAQMFPRADLLRSAHGYLQTLLPIEVSSSATVVGIAMPQHFIPRAPSSDHRLSHGRGVHSAVSRMKLWPAHVDDAGLTPILSKSAKAQHHANKSTSSTETEPALAAFQFPVELPADLVHAVASNDYAIRASTLGDIARAPVSACFMRFLHVHRDALLTMIHVSPALLGPKFMDFLLRIPDVLDVRAWIDVSFCMFFQLVLTGLFGRFERKLNSCATLCTETTRLITTVTLKKTKKRTIITNWPKQRANCTAVGSKTGKTRTAINRTMRILSRSMTITATPTTPTTRSLSS
jgi:hypothetical protein